MSGKAPPKGPRALLGTHPGSLSSPASSSAPLGTSHPHQHLLHIQPQLKGPPSSALNTNVNTRIGATPPTGPRSLQISRPPPPGPKYSSNSHTIPTVPNGLGPHSLQINRFPVSIKGKNRDIGTSSGVCILFIAYSRSLILLYFYYSRATMLGHRITCNSMAVRILIVSHLLVVLLGAGHLQLLGQAN